jgi:hypothetical protein
MAGYLIRTIVFEAANETDEGKAAVAYVILNRVESELRMACNRPQASIRAREVGPAVVKVKPRLAKVEPFKTVMSGDHEAIANLSLQIGQCRSDRPTHVRVSSLWNSGLSVDRIGEQTNWRNRHG